MKRIYHLFSLTVITGLLTLFVTIPADAQRGGRGGGGGGGGSHGGGGGGFHGGGGFAGGGGNRGGGFSGGGRPGGFSGGGRPGGFSNGGGRPGGFQGAPRSNNSIGGMRGGGFNGRPNGAGIGPRGNYGYNRGGFNGRGIVGGRGYAGRGGYYRPGFGGGYRGGYYGGFRGGFYNHSGFYGRYYAPRLGFSIGVLPYGYYPFYFGQDQYFYSGGYYYQQNDNNQYTVVEPPVGAEITSLPSNVQSIVIDGVQYYEANGVYYLPITRDDGSTAYQIAGKDGQLTTGTGGGDYQDDPNYQPSQNAPQGNVLQPGEVVQALPPDCRKVKIDNEKYYVDPAGIYYHEERDQYGQKVYRVTDINDQQ